MMHMEAVINADKEASGGGMDILVHNEPVPVLQIITVLIMEYQIKKVFLFICALSVLL